MKQMAKGKCIEKRASAKKIVYALCAMNDGTFQVQKLCENYDGKIKGGIRRTWRLVERGLNETEARWLFGKKVAAQ